MNAEYLRKQILPFVKNNRLTYDDFEKIFGFLPLKEQYKICDVLQDSLRIELVDEIISSPDDKNSPEKNSATIVRQPHEIKGTNKFLVQLIQNGDEQARQDICIKNRRLVFKFALKYQREYPGSRLELDDLVQEGFTGLLKAAEKFDFSKDTQFSTYAVLWIEQRILRAIADTGMTIRLPAEVVRKIVKVSKIDRQLQMQEIGLRQRLELIAEQMEITVEDVRRLFELREIYLHMKSLDAPVSEDLDSTLAEFIPDEKNPLEDAVSFTLLKEQIDEILNTLTRRERDVLSLRFGLFDGRERTLEEIGKIFHVTRERIRQIEAMALRKLRHPSRTKKLRDFL